MGVNLFQCCLLLLDRHCTRCRHIATCRVDKSIPATLFVLASGIRIPFCLLTHGEANSVPLASPEPVFTQRSLTPQS